mgnify:CR=1 FL=1
MSSECARQTGNKWSSVHVLSQVVSTLHLTIHSSVQPSRQASSTLLSVSFPCCISANRSQGDSSSSVELLTSVCARPTTNYRQSIVELRRCEWPPRFALSLSLSQCPLHLSVHLHRSHNECLGARASSSSSRTLVNQHGRCQCCASVRCQTMRNIANKGGWRANWPP